MARTKDDYICILQYRCARINWSATISALKTKVGAVTNADLQYIADRHRLRNASRYANYTTNMLMRELKSRDIHHMKTWSKLRMLDLLIDAEVAPPAPAPAPQTAPAPPSPAQQFDPELESLDLDCSLFDDDSKSTLSYATCITRLDMDAEFALMKANQKELLDSNKELRESNKELRDENKELRLQNQAIMTLLLQIQAQLAK